MKKRIFFRSWKIFFEQDGAKMHTKNEVLNYISSRCNLVCGWPANSPDLSPIEMMWSIIKFRISNYPNDLKPKNKVELIEAIQKEWRSIDAITVNNLVKSFKYRLRLCARVGGKTIVPFSKSHLYRDLEKVPIEEPPHVFDQLTDIKLMQYASQSWKKTGEILNLNPNLVKYRTNYFQCKYLNEHTPKIILCEDIVPRVFYILPLINGTSNIPIFDSCIDWKCGKHINNKFVFNSTIKKTECNNNFRTIATFSERSFCNNFN